MALIKLVDESTGEEIVATITRYGNVCARWLGDDPYGEPIKCGATSPVGEVPSCGHDRVNVRGFVEAESSDGRVSAVEFRDVLTTWPPAGWQG